MNRVVLRHALLVFTVTLAAWQIAGSLRTGDLPGNGDSWPLGATAIASGVLGWIIIGRRPELRLGWLTSWSGLVASVSGLAGWRAADSVGRGTGFGAADASAAWLAVWTSALPILLGVAIPLALLPNGTPRSPRWAKFVWLTASLVALASIGSAVSAAGVASSSAAELVDGSGVHRGTQANIALGLSALAWLAAICATVVSTVGVAVARRTATGEARRQFNCVLWGVGLVVTSMVASSLIEPLSGGRVHAPEALGTVFWLAIPASILVAVTRHQLYDVQVFVNRTVLVVGVATGLVFAYVASFALVTAILGSSFRLSPASVVAAALVGALAALAGRTIRAWTDRWFGRNPRLAAVASRFDADQALPTTLDSARQRLVDTVRDELSLGWVELKRAGEAPISSGVRFGRELDVKLTTGSGDVVTITATGRAGETLSRRDAENLRNIGHYVVLADESLARAEQLQQAERSVRTAQSDERRRVRRDLHDDIGPTLAAVRLKLVAYARLAPPSEMLTDSIAQVSDAIRELRRIVDGLQPSVVEDVGLLAAVEILIAGFASVTHIHFELDAPMQLPPVRATTAANAYRMIAEATTNVVRHSGASSCTVCLRVEDSRLHLTVRDDGHGLPETVIKGAGLRSIEARANDADGWVDVSTVPGGGTTVEANVQWDVEQ